jgi:hypothetical protein
MTTPTNHVSGNPDALHLDLEVIVSEEDNSVYVKFIGFDTIEEADDYATYLTETLPLLLFESGTKH